MTKKCGKGYARPTANDGPLVAFLQTLLVLDSTAQPGFGALASHPYLQQAQLLPSPNPQVDTPASLLAPVVMPSQDELLEAVSRIPGVDADMAASLQPIQGIPFLVWDPAAEPVTITASGTVYRCL